MACYEIRLWVSVEQETAIIELFKLHSWTYSRLDSQYSCSYSYQSEHSTSLSHDYITHVTNSVSHQSQQISDRKPETCTETQIRFDDSGGSFLSWLQNDVITQENIHDNRTGSNMEKRLPNTDVSCDPNQRLEHESQHDVHSETKLRNTESMVSEGRTDCQEMERHLEEFPYSKRVKSVNTEANLIDNQGGNIVASDCHRFTHDESQLAESQSNIDMPSSAYAQNAIVSGDNATDNLQNSNETFSQEKEFVAYKSNSAIVSKSIESELQVKVMPTDAKTIDQANSSLREQFSESYIHTKLDKTLQKHVPEVVSPTLTKLDEINKGVNESIETKANESNDEKNDSFKLNLSHEFNFGIKQLRNKLDHAVSKGKLKRKLEKEIDELSKLESQFDKLAAIEIQVDKISKYKSIKRLCKKDASMSNTRKSQKKTNNKEVESISTRSRTNQKRKLKSIAKKTRDKIGDHKVDIEHENNHDENLEVEKCDQKRQSKTKDSDRGSIRNTNSCSKSKTKLSNDANKGNKDSIGANKRVDIYCQECEHTFKYKKNYDKHLEEDKCRHVCEFCGKIFLSGETGNYKIHLKYHNRQTDHECLICGKQYVEFRKLKEHFRKHTGEAPYQCDECGLTFPGFTGLYSHKKIKHFGIQEQFYCSQCPKVFQRYSGLTFHMKYYHQAESDRPYSCTKCNKSFRTPDILKRHETTHRETKDYKCDQCPAAFKRIQGLTEHKRRHGKDFGHYCSHCSKGFYTRQSRLVHERVHTGEKPYQCGLCPYSSALNGNLKKHMKTHNRQDS